MAQTNGQPKQPRTHKGLGRGLFALYLGASLLFIGLIWIDNLTEKESDTPGYIRDSFVVDESVYLTVTAEAAEFAKDAATPVPDSTPTH